ncbi:MAG: lipase, partial [Leptolyngbya sp. SIO1D8]|nr:lipase [Leptolyngbya sp. SIO1D8]
LTTGEGACWGDGITPITAAHLAHAKNLVLQDVYHSPNPEIAWYGSPEIVNQWIEYLL